MAATAGPGESLKRLGGGRWQTRDERFTIEPESGTWVVLDGEQTDELGLPLVRGPFGSLTAAKEAIAAARDAAPVVSPLAARIAEQRDRPPAPAPATRLKKAPEPKTPQPKKPEPKKPEPPAEPKWLKDLQPRDRSQARELINRLTRAGIANPEEVARLDIVGNSPAVARLAIDRAMASLGPGATPDAVHKLLANGRADDLGVAWRLIDGEGRPIPD